MVYSRDKLYFNQIYTVGLMPTHMQKSKGVSDNPKMNSLLLHTRRIELIWTTLFRVFLVFEHLYFGYTCPLKNNKIQIKKKEDVMYKQL